MSATKATTIWCDGTVTALVAGNPITYQCGDWHEEQCDTIGMARATGPRGWTNTHGQDYCPTHSHTRHTKAVY